MNQIWRNKETQKTGYAIHNAKKGLVMWVQHGSDNGEDDKTIPAQEFFKSHVFVGEEQE